MRLSSVISSASRRALLGESKPPARRKKGRLPARLLAFDRIAADKDITKEVRRWLYHNFSGVPLDVPHVGRKIVQDARHRVLVFKEDPLEAVTLAVTCKLGVLAEHDEDLFGIDLRLVQVSARSAFAPHLAAKAVSRHA